MDFISPSFMVSPGAEANIIDYDGKLDIYDELLGQLDLVIASLHDACIAPGNIEQNTNALIGACENPYVNVIGHCGNPVYPVDYPRFLNAAKANDKIIEFNSRSLDLRGASRPNCKTVAQMCAKTGIKVAEDIRLWLRYGLKASATWMMYMTS